MNDLETTFSHTKDALALSRTEKASGRTELLAFMQEHPMKQPARSPFSGFLLSPALRYAMALVLVIGLSGSGVAYAAGNATPASPLYAVKVKVTEPVQLALTFDTKKRADREVALVNERLQEFAQMSVTDAPDAGTLALISGSLSERIGDAQDDILALHGTDASDAFETASDLESTLTAHTLILQKVQDSNPDANASVAAVAETVASELTETQTLVDSAQDTVEDTASTTLDATTDEQATDTIDALAVVREEVASALSSFDASDTTDIQSSLDEIQSLIKSAQENDAAGDTTAAYLLYTQADQKLTELKAALDADQSLGIDTIDSTQGE